MTARPCEASSCRINHFDIKPVRGGRPPRDRRTGGRRVVIIGAFAQEMASVLIVVALLNLNTRKAEKVIRKYVNRERSAKGGEN